MTGCNDSACSASTAPERQTISVAVQLGKELLSSKLLLAYVILGMASGLTAGAYGLSQAMANYLVLLPLYTLVIYFWTKGDTTLATSARTEASADPKRGFARDLSLVGLLFAFNLGVTAWFWAGGLPSVVGTNSYRLLQEAGWDQELTLTAAGGLTQTLFQLLPALVVVLVLFRLPPAQVGLIPRGLGLGLTLAVLGIGVGALLKLLLGITPTPLFKAPELVPLALTLYLAHMFVNGLPEEFIFRGAILTRLVPWFRNPHHALLLVSVLFTAIHVPSHVAQPSGLPRWMLLPVIPGPQPTGLIWGYLFYRTRSIWPGVLWHTSFLTLGVVFLG